MFMLQKTDDYLVKKVAEKDFGTQPDQDFANSRKVMIDLADMKA